MSYYEKKTGIRGIPHSQRGFINIVFETKENFDTILIEVDKLIKKIYEVIPSPEALVKRDKELSLAIKSWENSFFVEDVCRKVSEILENKKYIYGYVVEINSEESIHQHDAYAIIRKKEH